MNYDEISDLGANLCVYAYVRVCLCINRVQTVVGQRTFYIFLGYGFLVHTYNVRAVQNCMHENISSWGIVVVQDIDGNVLNDMMLAIVAYPFVAVQLSDEADAASNEGVMNPAENGDHRQGSPVKPLPYV
jgi:hypothetical protein